MDFLRASDDGLPDLPIDRILLRPSVTSNGLASICLAGKEVGPEAEVPWLFEPCFFLRGGLCSIYPVRPFACRSFGSTLNCGQSGVAEAPDWFVTLAIVTNQLLEDFDREGWWGNLADVLSFLAAERGEAACLAARNRLLPTQPLPGLLVMPDERPLLNQFLDRVQELTGYHSAKLRC